MIGDRRRDRNPFIRNIISKQSFGSDLQKREESKEEENDDFKSDNNSCPAFWYNLYFS